MGFNMWFIFASLLLVSVGASRYDQGPQKFYDVNSDPETAEQNENNDVILYLTPEQVRALEADGAVVQSPEDPENDESEPGLPAEPQVNEDQDEAPEQDETESAQEEEEEEAQEEEQENSEDIQNPDIDFEEILRILNEDQQVEEEETEEAAEEPARNEPQVEEDNNESPRNFSPRLTVRQQLQQQQQQREREERYLAPAVAKKEQVLKSYSFTRYQPNEQPQRANVQYLQQQEEESKEAEESDFTQEKKKYKLIPYEVEQTPASQDTAEEQAENTTAENDEQRLKELITALIAKRFTGANGQRGSKFQSVLREMKASPKYNKQKYAFEIERFMANSEKQNAASKVATKAKLGPTLSKQQLNKKRRLNKSKQGKGPARGAVSQKTQQLNFQKSFTTSANARPIAVPVIRAEKLVQRSIPVPVETSKRISVRNVYVRARTDKPYIISRRVSENKRQNPVNPRK